MIELKSALLSFGYSEQDTESEIKHTKNLIKDLAEFRGESIEDIEYMLGLSEHNKNKIEDLKKWGIII